MAISGLNWFTKCIIFLFWIYGSNAELMDHALLPVTPPNFTQLAKKAGLPCEEVDITTEDGYILTMFHIPGNKSHPIVMQSGNLGSADDYITRGKTSLPYVLWKAGYDVWVGNIRGCRYGRRHVSLNPDVDDEFWRFSINEFAIYDTPAMIDYVLNVTGASTVSSLGWSCGTQVNYILGAERPEYAEKVDVVISLAPICYLHHSKPFDALGPFAPILNDTLVMLDANEVLGENSTALSAIRLACSTPATAFEVCLELGFFPVVGYDPDQIEPEFAPILFQHYPAGTSRQNEIHLSQILLTKTFAKYDYGKANNLIRYGSEKPPKYDLSKNKMKVVLISGKNDQCSTLQDVDLLKTRLPNIVDHIILKPEKFNHVDFVCGRDTHKVLYEPIILDILKKYNNVGGNCKHQPKKKRKTD